MEYQGLKGIGFWVVGIVEGGVSENSFCLGTDIWMIQMDFIFCYIPPCRHIRNQKIINATTQREK